MKKTTSILLIFVMFFCAFITSCCYYEQVDGAENVFSDFHKDENGTIKFSATTYIQDISLSAMFPMDVIVDNGKININGVIYDDIRKAHHLDILYSNGLLSAANSDPNRVNIVQTLEMINDIDSCFILKSTNDSLSIAVYYVDSVCYLLSMSESGEVVRIHCVEIN